MTAEDDVRRRVEAFVADYHERWSRAGSNAGPAGLSFEEQREWMRNLDMARFDVWREEVRELEAAHGTPALKTGLEGSLSMHPDHDPAIETIQHVETRRGRATLRSMMPGSLQRYYEYRLRLIDGDWRIDRVVMSFDPPGVPVLPPAAASTLLARATDDALLPPLPDHLELDVDLLFTSGRRVRLLDEDLTTDVQPVGTLTTSGVLTVVDLGYVRAGVTVLSRRVPPGSYPVDVATAGRTNVALRLLLTDRPAVEHRVAGFADGSLHVSVDAGTVALADAGALVSADAQRIDAAFQEHTHRLIDGQHATFGVGGSGVDTVMVTSGFGDGGYPCYWGLDADGGLTELVVDFVVLAEDITRTTTVPFAVGTVSEPGLASLDFRIVESDGGYVLSCRGTSYVPWRLLSGDGTVLVEHNRLGTLVSDGVASSTWRPDAAPPAGSVLEVTEHLGYRHV